MGIGLAYLKAFTGPDRLEGALASRWIRGQMGDRAADVVWDPLLRAKFGAAAETIGLPWFWARVHDRTSKLGYCERRIPATVRGARARGRRRRR